MQEVHAQDASPVVPGHGVMYVPYAAVALATLLTRTFTSSLHILDMLGQAFAYACISAIGQAKGSNLIVHI